MNTNKLGDLYLSNMGKDAQIKNLSLFSAAETQSEETLLGMQQADKPFGPSYFHNPNTGIHSLDIETGTPRITLQYQDELRKNTPISSAYEVTVLLVYIEKHSEIEKIADPLERKKQYDRAISNSVFGVSS